MKNLLVVLAVLGSTFSAAAQTAAEPPFTLTCQDSKWADGRGDKQFCETRDLAMNAPAGQPLSIDGGTNGGISVHGWDGPNVRVRAKVQSWASTEAAAQARVRGITISTDKNTLRATVPGQDGHWGVSYEVFVPRQTALVLNTLNGGIGLDGVQADVKFHAVNGGVTLADLGGQVTGQTVNGGLTIRLTGAQWAGQGLDVATTNGGIRWQLPREYSAQLFTSTEAGSIRTGLPVTKSGYLHKEVTASLGRGGAPVKAVTTNGGITVEQGRD